MAHPAIPKPELIIDLDALRAGADVLVPWTPPAVVDGDLVTHPRLRGPGPLDPVRGVYPTALRGGIVTDPAEIAAIRRSFARHARPSWWRRALTWALAR